MPRRRLLAVYLSILAVWVQFFVPVAVANAGPQLDSLSIICSHAQPASTDGSQPAPASADHECCSFCQAQMQGATLDTRPVFTTFDYPIASPLRWRPVATLLLADRSPPQHRPRGPPSLV